jgi:hypothetical protein
MLARPADGRVRVREWRGGEFAEPAAPREATCEAVLRELDELRRAGRRVHQSDQAVRLWLTGGA